VLLLVSLTGERAIYLALELDRSWTEMSDLKRPTNPVWGAKLRMAKPLFAGCF